MKFPTSLRQSNSTFSMRCSIIDHCSFGHVQHTHKTRTKQNHVLFCSCSAHTQNTRHKTSRKWSLLTSATLSLHSGPGGLPRTVCSCQGIPRPWNDTPCSSGCSTCPVLPFLEGTIPEQQYFRCCLPYACSRWGRFQPAWGLSTAGVRKSTLALFSSHPSTPGEVQGVGSRIHQVFFDLQATAWYSFARIVGACQSVSLLFVFWQVQYCWTSVCCLCTETKQFSVAVYLLCTDCVQGKTSLMHYCCRQGHTVHFGLYQDPGDSWLVWSGTHPVHFGQVALNAWLHKLWGTTSILHQPPCLDVGKIAQQPF